METASAGSGALSALPPIWEATMLVALAMDETSVEGSELGALSALDMTEPALVLAAVERTHWPTRTTDVLLAGFDLILRAIEEQELAALVPSPDGTMMEVPPEVIARGRRRVAHALGRKAGDIACLLRLPMISLLRKRFPASADGRFVPWVGGVLRYFSRMIDERFWAFCVPRGQLVALVRRRWPDSHAAGLHGGEDCELIVARGREADACNMTIAGALRARVLRVSPWSPPPSRWWPDKWRVTRRRWRGRRAYRAYRLDLVASLVDRALLPQSVSTRPTVEILSRMAGDIGGIGGSGESLDASSVQLSPAQSRDVLNSRVPRRRQRQSAGRDFVEAVAQFRLDPELAVAELWQRLCEKCPGRFSIKMLTVKGVTEPRLHVDGSSVSLQTCRNLITALRKAPLHRG